MRLKDRYHSPPGGFQFFQPETGWKQTTWDFEQLVRELQSHRKANPRFNLNTDTEVIRSEIDTANALRCQSIAGAEHFILNEGVAPPKSLAPATWLRNVVGAGVSLVAPALGSWLGKGGIPVARELAEHRAGICARCPKNGRGDLTRYFTVPAANQIRKDIEHRNNLKLSTSHDPELGVCEACSCPLQLKVHVTLEDIIEHTTPEIKADLHSDCWILHERQR